MILKENSVFDIKIFIYITRRQSLKHMKVSISTREAKKSKHCSIHPVLARSGEWELYVASEMPKFSHKQEKK